MLVEGWDCTVKVVKELQGVELSCFGAVGVQRYRLFGGYWVKYHVKYDYRDVPHCKILFGPFGSGQEHH